MKYHLPGLFFSAVLLSISPAQARPHRAKTTAVSPQRAAMNQFLKALQTKNIKAFTNLVSPTKGINFPGVQASETRADLVKSPDSSLSYTLLFDSDYPGFVPVREFPRIQWVLAGDRFVPSKSGKNFQKSEVFVRFVREGGAYKIVEVGSPPRGDAG